MGPRAAAVGSDARWRACPAAAACWRESRSRATSRSAGGTPGAPAVTPAPAARARCTGRSSAPQPG